MIQTYMLPDGGWLVQVNARYYPGYYESRLAALTAAEVDYETLDAVWRIRRTCTCCGASNRGDAMILGEVRALVGLRTA